jgi:hypothetical protein
MTHAPADGNALQNTICTLQNPNLYSMVQLVFVLFSGGDERHRTGTKGTPGHTIGKTRATYIEIVPCSGTSTQTKSHLKTLESLFLNLNLIYVKDTDSIYCRKKLLLTSFEPITGLRD